MMAEDRNRRDPVAKRLAAIIPLHSDTSQDIPESFFMHSL